MKTRAVLLSPERYAKRRARCLASFAANGGRLRETGLEWFRATPLDRVFTPRGHWFRHVARQPHYWAATRDHMTILDQALVDGVDELFVFEDDSVFTPDFDEALAESISKMPPGWRALQLNWNGRPGGKEARPGLLGAAGHGGGMMANLWSREGMIRFHGHAWSRPNHIIDANYDDLRMKEPGMFFRPLEEIVVQDPIATGRGRDC